MAEALVSTRVDVKIERTVQVAPGQDLETTSYGIAEHRGAPRLVPPPEPEPLPRTWTVSSLVRHVRGLVEQGYGQITVEGEISNWRPAGSGHCYFTVKDTGAQLSAVLFRRQASLLRFRPSDGDAVRLHGQLSVFESRGQMQLIVEWMEQVGFGALLAAVQRLKETLRREGLFDRKRALPPFPRCIGVVTSLQGAALRDIIKVCRRRHAAVRLLIYPAAVQGPNCPAEIAAGVRWFSAHPDHAEVVLVARGGGSWEDLHGFDEESVVRAIAACTLPIITGIGHATDSTIADAAADICAPTPSAAAEMLTAAQHRVEDHIERLHGRLLRATSFELLRTQGRFAKLNAGNVLRRVQDGLNRRAQRTDELGFRSESAVRQRLRRLEMRLGTLSAKLARQNPALQLTESRRQLELLQNRLRQSSQRQTMQQRTRVDRCVTRLEALSPLRVLERGYALVYDANGHLLRDAEVVRAGEEIRARLGKGDVRARVLPPIDVAISQP
ncbi:MAG: exodeoxyribonuclease VII large subunit [Janthinobacterium lividum]